MALSLKASEKLILALSLLWAALVLALGAWWLYLLAKGASGISVGSLQALIKWEGGTFLLALMLISAALFYLYRKNERKGRSLQTFFTAMTHELKTPLASVRLQAEVLEGELGGNPRLASLASRLIEDTQKLETRMDKILQLSRMEGGGNLAPRGIDLPAFLADCHRKWGQGLGLEVIADSPPDILADDFALELILRNLFENTRLHSARQQVAITLRVSGSRLVMDYQDGGRFKGDSRRIGSLFYKHASKGSGIGLYLVGLLMRRMGGELAIDTTEELILSMNFPLARGRLA